MDDLTDIFKILRFLSRLRNFREMSILQKGLTILGGLGLIFSLFLFFWTPGSVDAKDFKLGPGHLVAYEACTDYGDGSGYFGDVPVDGSCGCYARFWANGFSPEYQTDIKPGLAYMFDHYAQIDWSEVSDVAVVDRRLSDEYASKAGKLNMPKRTPDMMRRQMSKLTKVTEICTNSDYLTVEGVSEIVALGLKEVVMTPPQSEADVVIALRGASDVTHLSASN